MHKIYAVVMEWYRNIKLEYKWDTSQLPIVVKQHESYSAVLKHFGLNGAGANYRVLKKLIRKMGIDVSHFKNGKWSTNINKDILLKIISNSYSYAQVLQALDAAYAGGNIATLKRIIRDNNIDISHFKGQAIQGGKKIGYKYPIQYYLVNDGDSKINSHLLKIRLIKENIFEYKCYRCGISEWQGEKIGLQLHHINGNPDDNRLENLTILCPNCHSLTPNFANKNRNKLV